MCITNPLKISDFQGNLLHMLLFPQKHAFLFFDSTNKRGAVTCATASWCDREDSNLWPSGSENYDKPVQTNVEA